MAREQESRFRRAIRRTGLVLGSLVVAFLVGFVWQYRAARSAQAELHRVEAELARQRLANTLGAAAVQATWQGHDAARELASDFFTGLDRFLSSQTERGVPLAELQAILAARDDVITAVSRAEPGSAETLTRLFLSFRAATGSPDPVPAGLSAPASATDESGDRPPAPSVR